jgi:hypothetical protein
MAETGLVHQLQFGIVMSMSSSSPGLEPFTPLGHSRRLPPVKRGTPSKANPPERCAMTA